MAQAAFSVRMDENLKKQFEMLCNDFGMNVTTAFTIFAKAVVRERQIPFKIAAPEPDMSLEAAIQDVEEGRIFGPYSTAEKAVAAMLEEDDA